MKVREYFPQLFAGIIGAAFHGKKRKRREE
jgi:hypothetical protein